MNGLLRLGVMITGGTPDECFCLPCPPAQYWQGFALGVTTITFTWVLYAAWSAIREARRGD